MKRDVRDKRHKLYQKSVALRGAHFDPECKNCDKILKEQDSIYKQWCFYDGFIKAKEKLKNSK